MLSGASQCLWNHPPDSQLAVNGAIWRSSHKVSTPLVILLGVAVDRLSAHGISPPLFL